MLFSFYSSFLKIYVYLKLHKFSPYFSIHPNKNKFVPIFSSFLALNFCYTFSINSCLITNIKFIAKFSNRLQNLENLKISKKKNSKYRAGFPTMSKFSVNFCFEKMFSGGLVYTGCAAKFGTMAFFSRFWCNYYFCTYVLFTRQQLFCKFSFPKFYLSKKIFLKGSKHKNGKKSVQIDTNLHEFL